MTILFHQHLRETARPVWEAIFAHPFVRELGAGTLARARFLFFVRQDYLYLQDFARALCLGGAKADSLETLDMFAEAKVLARTCSSNSTSSTGSRQKSRPPSASGCRNILCRAVATNTSFGSKPIGKRDGQCRRIESDSFLSPSTYSRR